MQLEDHHKNSSLPTTNGKITKLPTTQERSPSSPNAYGKMSQPSHNLWEDHQVLPQPIGRSTSLPITYGKMSYSLPTTYGKIIKSSHNLCECVIVFIKPMETLPCFLTTYGKMSQSSHNLWEDVIVFPQPMGRSASLPTPDGKMS